MKFINKKKKKSEKVSTYYTLLIVIQSSEENCIAAILPSAKFVERCLCRNDDGIGLWERRQFHSPSPELEVGKIQQLY